MYDHSKLYGFYGIPICGVMKCNEMLNAVHSMITVILLNYKRSKQHHAKHHLKLVHWHWWNQTALKYRLCLSLIISVPTRLYLHAESVCNPAVANRVHSWSHFPRLILSVGAIDHEAMYIEWSRAWSNTVDPAQPTKKHINKDRRHSMLSF